MPNDAHPVNHGGGATRAIEAEERLRIRGRPGRSCGCEINVEGGKNENFSSSSHVDRNGSGRVKSGRSVYCCSCAVDVNRQKKLYDKGPLAHYVFPDILCAFSLC